jgi:hypothetical protein
MHGTSDECNFILSNGALFVRKSLTAIPSKEQSRWYDYTCPIRSELRSLTIK